MTKRIKRAQAPKPNRHTPDARVRRALDLRNGSRTARHTVHEDDRAFRKYGVRSIKD